MRPVRVRARPPVGTSQMKVWTTPSSAADPAAGADLCWGVRPGASSCCRQSVVKIANLVILRRNEPPGTGGFGRVARADSNRRYAPTLASVDSQSTPYFFGTLSVERDSCRGPPVDVLLPICCPTMIKVSGPGR